ncbi:hypothetical protein KOR34_36150 [Posidoniimonas corsicana]|uniref:Uncharacterized protein n=1 Tax=Posidoniimonas corsicana TaxID=1938618 RepID=A0A5C5V682_9BACT|nr:hypothetical protein [Posidoniimonas corsicana]TWT33781.1 hypothetical protein KOR34_36150 [Posidoniimonas corsicana]
MPNPVVCRYDRCVRGNHSVAAYSQSSMPIKHGIRPNEYPIFDFDSSAAGINDDTNSKSHATSDYDFAITAGVKHD